MYRVVLKRVFTSSYIYNIQYIYTQTPNITLISSLLFFEVVAGGWARHIAVRGPEQPMRKATHHQIPFAACASIAPHIRGGNAAFHQLTVVPVDAQNPFAGQRVMP